MGNASAEVQKQAQYVTTSYEEEGFANAVEQFILGRNTADIPKKRLQLTL
jgi:hydroxymethylpyrimidine pyrophosphatase-like HAD family hydrolase